jgi:FKBP-type peptidyl-prolyl cis-trans isomerase (trigger factor)
MADPITPNTTFTLTLPWKEIEPIYQSTLKKIAKRVKLPGFRPGMVPAALAEGSIDPDRLVGGVLETVVPKHYLEALKKDNLQPIAEPRFTPEKYEKGADWTVKVEIAQTPELSVKTYEKVAATALKERQRTLAAKPKDKVVEHDHHDHEGHDHDHSHHDHSHSLADPAKAEKQAALQAVVKALVDKFSPQVPSLLVEQSTRQQLDSLVKALDQMKMPLDAYLKRRQITFETLTQELAGGVIGEWQVEFLLSAITTEAKLEVSDKDLTAELEKQTAQITDAAKRAEQQKYEPFRAHVRRQLLREKTLDHLLNLK